LLLFSTIIVIIIILIVINSELKKPNVSINTISSTSKNMKIAGENNMTLFIILHT